MFGDGYSGETYGERYNEHSEYYERWKDSMNDAPEYMGDETAEWEKRKRRQGEETEDTDEENNDFAEREELEPDATTVAFKPPIAEINSPEHRDDLQNPDDANNLQNAGKMVNYGLDTASRVYGLNEVLRVLDTLDETGRDADNPIGTFYERLARTPEQRANLYREIQRDTVLIANGGMAEHEMDILVGLDDRGSFYDKSLEDDEQNQKSVLAIQAMKNLLRALETGEDFAGLRKRAEAAGMTPIDYLLREEFNPTLTYFLNQASGELNGDVEEITKALADEEVRRADEEAAEAIAKVADSDQVDQQSFTIVHEKVADKILRGNDLSDEEIEEAFQDEKAA